VQIEHQYGQSINRDGVFDNVVADFNKGMRVQAHAATDTWMRGDRYGSVARIGRRYIWVKMDRSERVIRFAPEMLQIVE